MGFNCFKATEYKEAVRFLRLSFLMSWYSFDWCQKDMGPLDWESSTLITTSIYVLQREPKSLECWRFAWHILGNSMEKCTWEPKKNVCDWSHFYICYVLCPSVISFNKNLSYQQINKAQLMHFSTIKKILQNFLTWIFTFFCIIEIKHKTYLMLPISSFIPS